MIRCRCLQHCEALKARRGPLRRAPFAKLSLPSDDSSPSVSQLVIIFLFANYVPAIYGHYEFPEYAERIGWLLALGPCALIPIVAVYKFFRKIPCRVSCAAHLAVSFCSCCWVGYCCWGVTSSLNLLWT